MREVKTPAADMIAAMTNALCIASTNSSVATPKVDGFMPTKRAESTLLEMKVAKIALIKAKLSDCPKNRMVASVPDAIPRWSFSTDPITALVLGDENNPIPNPTINNLAATSADEELRLKVLVNKSPTLITAIPDDANIRDPILSESQPLMGDKIAMLTGMMKSITPACSGE
jgi:hypothetical protein